MYTTTMEAIIFTIFFLSSLVEGVNKNITLNVFCCEAFMGELLIQIEYRIHKCFLYRITICNDELFFKLKVSSFCLHREWVLFQKGKIWCHYSSKK